MELGAFLRQKGLTMPVSTDHNFTEQAASIRQRFATLNADKRGADSHDYFLLQKDAFRLAKAIDSSGENTGDNSHIADSMTEIGESCGVIARGLPVRKLASRMSPGDPIGSGGRYADSLDSAHAIPTAQFAKTDNLDNGGFGSFGEFLASIRQQVAGVRFDDRLAELTAPQGMAVGQTKSSDSSGGFLVPDFFQSVLVTSAIQAQPWLEQRQSFIVPDGQGDIVRPMLADRDKSGESIGGVALSRMAESGQIPLSTAIFESRRDQLTKAATRIRMSNELLTDSAVGVDSAITALFGQAVALRQGLDMFRGSGAGEPLGFLKSGALYTVGKETSQVGDTIVYQNIVKMVARLSPASFSRSIWLAHPGTIEQLSMMALNIGTSGTPVWLFDAGSAPQQTIMGRPIYFTEAASLLGDLGDISLIDPQSYLYGQKRVRIDVSRDFRFDFDESEFRLILRDAGGPVYGSTQKDVQGYEHSEFVTLAARA